MSQTETGAPEGTWLVAGGKPGNARFGMVLKTLRERSGLSAQQLADQAHVHVSFVRGIERGAQAPSMARARALLACMKEQDRIRWTDDGPHDLLIRDPTSGRDAVFEFKAAKKGQNRRPETDQPLDAAIVGLKAFADATRGLPSEEDVAVVLRPALESLIRGLPRAQLREPAAASGPAAEGPPEAAPADPARFGIVVRLLAGADAEMLENVEKMLLSEPGLRHLQS